MMPNIPPAVRILPMSRDEPEFSGRGIDEVQMRFFLGEMPWPPNPGRYQYRKKGLEAEQGTVVLFQFAAHIIASATFVRIERYQQPDGPYYGALWFDPASIQVFKPVSAEVLHKHWPEKFVKFGQAPQELDPPSRYPEFERELLRIDWPTRPAPQAHDLEAPPAARVQTTVSRIVRNTELAKRVKVLHKYECQICGYTIILADGSQYAESHHIQPLGEPHNGPDVMENIICLCPNHHAACDFGAIRLDPNNLRRAVGHCMHQRYVDYHNHTVCQGLST